jgi:tRNA A22 N-methylase
LEFARTQIEKQGADVTLIQSNGLEKIPFCPHSSGFDVIIAGMGGELIAEIVEKMPCCFKNDNLRLILQPMTRAEHLRQGLHRTGFEIVHEKTVCERGRNFTIIYAKTIESGET